MALSDLSFPGSMGYWENDFQKIRSATRLSDCTEYAYATAQRWIEIDQPAAIAHLRSHLTPDELISGGIPAFDIGLIAAKGMDIDEIIADCYGWLSARDEKIALPSHVYIPSPGLVTVIPVRVGPDDVRIGMALVLQYIGKCYKRFMDPAQYPLLPQSLHIPDFSRYTADIEFTDEFREML
jgi:hypothetical protein